MLSEKQLGEIREHLERAQNPVFLYDNDADGLCSFVLLRRFLGRGKGVAVRTHPEIDAGYAKRALELGADYVFVLDRPFLGKDFVESLSLANIPIVWIDHHDTGEKYPNVHAFNSHQSKRLNDAPVSYWTYMLTKRKEDLWIAIMGCISDRYLPDFSSEFEEKYGEYWGKVKEAFDVYYKTEIGLFARSLSFGLKDSITHVVYLQNFLITSDISDMRSELESNSSFGQKYKDLRKKYDELILKAKDCAEDKLIFFSYGGDMSMSADLANELSYVYPKHLIAVAYIKGASSNISLRGSNVREIIERLLPKFEGATGGGHKDAVGVRLRSADIDKFKEELTLAKIGSV